MSNTFDNWAIKEVAISTALRPPEKELYQRMWEYPEYRQHSSGVDAIKDFLYIVKPTPGSTILDIGCGPGLASLMLVDQGMDVTMLDFTDNSLHPNVAQLVKDQKLKLHFIQADITEKFPVSAEYGFCVDVMEHIATDQVDTVIDNCLQACRFIYFEIAGYHDSHGPKYLGYPLHLTVKPCHWWLDKFKDHKCVIYGYKNTQFKDKDGNKIDAYTYNFFVGPVY